MKGKELIFIASAVIAGLLIFWLQAGNSARTESADLSSESNPKDLTRQESPTEPNQASQATNINAQQVARPYANRDTSIVDEESLEALGISGYEEFIYRDDNWDAEEEKLYAEEQSEGKEHTDNTQWAGFSDDSEEQDSPKRKRIPSS